MPIITLCLSSCLNKDSNFKWQDSIADSIVAFYQIQPSTFDFINCYYSANSKPSIIKGNTSIYFNKGVNYRIRIDTLTQGNLSQYMGFDVCKNVRYFGCNYTQDTTYESLESNTNQMMNLIGSHQPDYIFNPDTFRNQFLDKKRFIMTFEENPHKTFYTISSIDTNTYRDEMLTTKKSVVTYNVSKENYGIQSYSFIWEYIIDNVTFKDSSGIFYKYHNWPIENIIGYIEAFTPFKKEDIANDSITNKQDTVSVFPAFTLPDVYARNYSSSECKSKYTLVEFWYRSCLPCMKNIKRLNTIRSSIDKSILEIVAINDLDELNKESIDFVNKFDVNYIVLFKGQELAKDLGIISHPITFIYDSKTRKIIYSNCGTNDNYSEEIINFIKKQQK